MSTKSQVLWRRNKVHEYLVKGLNQYEIADILKVSKSTVNNDALYLKEMARVNMKNHLEDRLAETFESCFRGVNEVLKNAWVIISQEEDSRTKLSALSTANECYRMKMDLVTNSTVVGDALKFVEHKNNIKINEIDAESEYETTTKAVF